MTLDRSRLFAAVLDRTVLSRLRLSSTVCRFPLISYIKRYVRGQKHEKAHYLSFHAFVKIF